LPDLEEKNSEIIIFSQYVLASIFFFWRPKNLFIKIKIIKKREREGSANLTKGFFWKKMAHSRHILRKTKKLNCHFCKTGFQHVAKRLQDF
jgi:hypothetical protein